MKTLYQVVSMVAAYTPLVLKVYRIHACSTKYPHKVIIHKRYFKH